MIDCANWMGMVSVGGVNGREEIHNQFNFF